MVSALAQEGEVGDEVQVAKLYMVGPSGGLWLLGSQALFEYSVAKLCQ